MRATLVADLVELAEELDKMKSGGGDSRWLKWQGGLVREAVAELAARAGRAD